MNIFSVFFRIDKPEHKNWIVEQQSFSFLDGACKAENYIEHFPFMYYLILKNVSDMPAILGDSLRQRFEMINMQSHQRRRGPLKINDYVLYEQRNKADRSRKTFLDSRRKTSN